MIPLKNSNQISAMMEAGRITGEALLVAREHVREGVSTYELDKLIREHIEKSGDLIGIFKRYHSHASNFESALMTAAVVSETSSQPSTQMRSPFAA